MAHFLAAAIIVLWSSPAQPHVYPDLRIAENDLARLGILEKDGQPTLIEIKTDTGFHDVLVTVQEAPAGSLMFGAGVNSNAGLTSQIHSPKSGR